MDDIIGIATNLEVFIGHDGATALRNVGPRDYFPMYRPWAFLATAEERGWIGAGTAFALRNSMLKWEV